jgi:hypothetical protein
MDLDFHQSELSDELVAHIYDRTMELIVGARDLDADSIYWMGVREQDQTYAVTNFDVVIDKRRYSFFANGDSLTSSVTIERFFTSNDELAFRGIKFAPDQFRALKDAMNTTYDILDKVQKEGIKNAKTKESAKKLKQLQKLLRYY